MKPDAHAGGFVAGGPIDGLVLDESGNGTPLPFDQGIFMPVQLHVGQFAAGAYEFSPNGESG